MLNWFVTLGRHGVKGGPLRAISLESTHLFMPLFAWQAVDHSLNILSYAWLSGDRVAQTCKVLHAELHPLGGMLSYVLVRPDNDPWLLMDFQQSDKHQEVALVWAFLRHYVLFKLTQGQITDVLFKALWLPQWCIDRVFLERGRSVVPFAGCVIRKHINKWNLLLPCLAFGI